MIRINFHDDRDILRNISDGDEGSFSELYEMISPAVYGVAFNWLKDKFLAEDVVQEVFVKLWSVRAGLLQINNIENYIFIITRNSVFTAFKKLLRENKAIAVLKQKGETSSVGNGSEKLEEKEYRNVLSKAVALLPSQQKRVYLLSEEGEMTYEQIAATMHLSKETVKRHLALARKFVRAYANQHLHPFVVLPACVYFLM